MLARVLLLAVGLLTAEFAAAPAAPAADVEADAKLLEKGRLVWLTAGGIGCAGCHGRFGEGDVGVGPYNRGVGTSKIRASIRSVPQMGMVKTMSDADIEAVAAYNSWLGRHQLVKTLLKRERFQPASVDVFPGTPLQLVINNSGQSAHKFSGSDLGVGEFPVEGKTVQDFAARAPAEEGSYALRCMDCGPRGQEFIIKVSRGAKPFRASEATEK